MTMNNHSFLIPLLVSFLAGFSTLFGSLIFLFFNKIQQKYLSFLLGFSAGTMVYISFVELLPYSIKNIGLLNSNLAFFGGIILILLIDFLVPHQYLQEKMKVSPEHKKLLNVGLMTFLGIAIHNFPEGMAVFMGSMVNLKAGYVLAIATALHNIPEGIAVAVPIYLATKSKKKAFYCSFFSGMAEPVGAIISYLILKPFITPGLLAGLYAFVAGIMIFISFDELLPSCFENSQGHNAILGIISGMGIVFLSLYLM